MVILLFFYETKIMSLLSVPAGGRCVDADVRIGLQFGGYFFSGEAFPPREMTFRSRKTVSRRGK